MSIHRDCDLDNKIGTSIYTYGSKINAITGCDFALFREVKLEIVKSYKLNEESAVFMAELITISKSIDFTRSFPESINIYTDSISSLQALESTSYKNEIVHKI